MRDKSISGTEGDVHHEDWKRRRTRFTTPAGIIVGIFTYEEKKIKSGTS